MKFTTMLSLGWLTAALVAVGCGTPGSVPKAASVDQGKLKVEREDSHAHGKGPNGGVVFDFGKYHAEFTVDHDKKECTVLVLGQDEKTITPVAAKDLTLTTKEAKTKDGKTVAPMTIKLLPQGESGGKASKFVGTDPGLGHVVDFAGTLIGEIDGKPSQGEFQK
jgi:hypothetical protein